MQPEDIKDYPNIAKWKNRMLEIPEVNNICLKAANPFSDPVPEKAKL